ncbi:MAG: nickel pincer cofactor biosynthesis protein LarC [Desulfobulbus sp.]
MLAYLDCFSGVSGNMLLGALLDAGYSESSLRETLAHLPLHGCALTIGQQTLNGFAATRVVVEGHGHDHHGHHHPHRSLDEISRLLGQSSLPAPVCDRALAVFTRLAEAEAAVHGTAIETIHFHEVGAMDAMIDIVGVVAGCVYLGIDRLVCSPLPMTRGWVRCAHGEIPLPAPAVCRLLDGVPVYGLDLDQELVTPTGAALVRELAAGFGPLPPMRLVRTGYGAGTLVRSDGRPNLLRLMLGQATEVAEAQQVEVIETHLDDWNPEFWPHVSEQLMQAGALDVCLVPVQMKKGRPGFLLRVIAEASVRPSLTDLIFRETSAIGLRLRREDRLTLPRKTVTVSTPWGELPAKAITTAMGTVIAPEYEVCLRVAQEHHLPLREVYVAFRRFSSSSS